MKKQSRAERKTHHAAIGWTSEVRRLTFLHDKTWNEMKKKINEIFEIEAIILSVSWAFFLKKKMDQTQRNMFYVT